MLYNCSRCAVFTRLFRSQILRVAKKMSRSMPKDDKAKGAVGQTRQPGEEEEIDRQEVVIVDNQPTNEVVVVVVDDDDAEEVDCCDSPDCLLVGDLDQPKESQCTDRRDKETCAMGQRGEPVVEG